MKLVYIIIIFSFALGFVALAPNAYAHHVTTHIPVESAPMRMDLVDDLLYIAHMSKNQITIVDTKTNEVIKEIPTSGGLIALEVAPDKNKIYAAVFATDGIDVYDAETGLWEKTITLPDAQLIEESSSKQPWGQRSSIVFYTGGWDLDYNPNNELLYVASYNGDVVRVIDTKVDQVMETLPVADDPYSVKVDPITNKVLVSSLSGNAVTIITPQSDGPNISHEVTSELQTGTAPWCLDIDPVLHYAYVSHRGSSNIAVVNILEENIAANIPLNGRAQCVTVDAPEHRVYASLFTSDEFVKINGETFEVIDKITTNGPVWDLIVDPNTHNLYASYQGNDEIVVLSPESISETHHVVTLESPLLIISKILTHGQDVRLIDPYVSILEAKIVAGVSTKDGGNLVIVIPRVLLDAQENGNDSDFEVVIGTTTQNYDEVNTTDDSRTISLFVPEGSKYLEIIGTEALTTPKVTESMSEKMDESKIVCEGKVWLESISGKLACTWPATAQKLVERGWGTIIGE